jgi:hypothetical protein
MKKIMLLVPVVFIILASGCTSQNPEQIVNNAIANAEKTDDYKMEYNLKISMAGMSMSGTSTFYKKADRVRTDTSMFMLGVPVTTSNYEIDGHTYTCSSSMGKITCAETEKSSFVPGPEKSMDMMNDFIKKGVVRMAYINSPAIAGAACDNVSFDFDPAKFSEAAAELTGQVDTETAQSNVRTFRMSSCYDRNTGLPLEMSMDIDIAESETFSQVAMSIQMTATSFQLAPVDDFVFTLPAEPAAENDYEVESECETVADCVYAGLCASENNCTCKSGFCLEDMEPGENNTIGGQTDEYGCLTAAGYSWCEEKQKCLRVWEENCTAA